MRDISGPVRFRPPPPPARTIEERVRDLERDNHDQQGVNAGIMSELRRISDAILQLTAQIANIEAQRDAEAKAAAPWKKVFYGVITVLAAAAVIAAFKIALIVQSNRLPIP